MGEGRVGTTPQCWVELSEVVSWRVSPVSR
jgi:hypothetical protein